MRPFVIRVSLDFSSVPQAAAADIHGVSPRTLRRWTAAGCPRNSDGTYCTAATIVWRVEQFHDRRGVLVQVPP
jgi:phage terminase Nu1 subunit (DNA packaging protein)